MENDNISRIFDAIRFPLIFVIVASHVIISRIDEPVYLSLSGDNLYSFLSQLFARSLVRMAVPCFAFISGYYFFFKYSDKFTLSDYGTALKKRTYSLFIPFIIWGGVYYIALWGKNALANTIGFDLGVSSVEVTLLSHVSLVEFIFAPMHATTWYLKSLIFASIFSPLVFHIIKYTKQWSLWVALVLYLFICKPGYFDRVYYFFFFGAYFSLMKINLLKEFCKFYRITTTISAIGFPLLVLFNMAPWHAQMERILIPIGIVALIGIFDNLHRNRTEIFNWCLRQSRATFFIYLAHTILLINIVRDGLYNFTTLGSTGWGKIFIYFATTIIVTYTCNFLYRLGTRYTPKTLSILVGGR